MNKKVKMYILICIAIFFVISNKAYIYSLVMICCFFAKKNKIHLWILNSSIRNCLIYVKGKYFEGIKK